MNISFNSKVIQLSQIRCRERDKAGHRKNHLSYYTKNKKQKSFEELKHQEHKRNNTKIAYMIKKGESK